MAVPFSNTKLRPPHGFRNILEGLSREVLRCHPGDIYAFGSLHFDKLLKIRNGSGVDPAEIGDELEDRFYNKIFKHVCVKLTEEDLAAIKIQTKYRQYRAKKALTHVRQNRAAIKIQAVFRGYQARVEVQIMRELALMAAEEARLLAEAEDALQREAEGDFPTMEGEPDIPDDGEDHEESELDMSDPEVAEAALNIQPAMKGFLFRQSLNLEASTDSIDRPARRYDPDRPDLRTESDHTIEVSEHSSEYIVIDSTTRAEQAPDTEDAAQGSHMSVVEDQARPASVHSASDKADDEAEP